MAVRSVHREGETARRILPHRDVPVRIVVHVADRDTAGSAPIPSHPSVLHYLHLRPLPVDTDAYQLLECYVRVSAER